MIFINAYLFSVACTFFMLAKSCGIVQDKNYYIKKQKIFVTGLCVTASLLLFFPTFYGLKFWFFVFLSLLINMQFLSYSARKLYSPYVTQYKAIHSLGTKQRFYKQQMSITKNFWKGEIATRLNDISSYNKSVDAAVPAKPTTKVRSTQKTPAKAQDGGQDMKAKIAEQKKKLRDKIKKARMNAQITRKQEEIDKTEKMIQDVLVKYNLTEEMLMED